jgi:myosin heavy subunit
MSDDTELVKVYIRDQAYAWLPASIVSFEEDKAVVKIDLPRNWHSSTVLCQDSSIEELEDALVAGGGSRNEEKRSNKEPNALRVVPLELYPNGQLPLQNKNGHRSDMASLPHLHEAAMLYNLKDRNMIGKPYTRVRDVLVAVNPFRRIEKLYSKEMQRFYAQQLVWAKGRLFLNSR